MILAIRMKGKEYFEKRGYEIFSHYLAPPENISFLEATRNERCLSLDLYTKGEIDEVHARLYILHQFHGAAGEDGECCFRFDVETRSGR